MIRDHVHFDDDAHLVLFRADENIRAFLHGGTYVRMQQAVHFWDESGAGPHRGSTSRDANAGGADDRRHVFS